MNAFKKMTFAITAGLVALTLPLSHSIASEIYRWVDDNGQVHFSQRPPEGKNSERVQSSTPRSFGQNIEDEPVEAPATTETPETAPANEEAGDEQAETTDAPAIQKDSALCNKAQESKKMLMSVPIIRRNGKVMSVEEKNEELKYVEEIISVHC